MGSPIPHDLRRDGARGVRQLCGTGRWKGERHLLASNRGEGGGGVSGEFSIMM